MATCCCCPGSAEESSLQLKIWCNATLMKSVCFVCWLLSGSYRSFWSQYATVWCLHPSCVSALCMFTRWMFLNQVLWTFIISEGSIKPFVSFWLQFEQCILCKINMQNIMELSPILSSGLFLKRRKILQQRCQTYYPGARIGPPRTPMWPSGWLWKMWKKTWIWCIHTRVKLIPYFCEHVLSHCRHCCCYATW